MLTYDVASGSALYEGQAHGSSGGNWFSLSTVSYNPNSSVKQYISNIAGAKSLSGWVYDTLLYHPSDPYTSRAVDTNITFSVLNDSTLSFDCDLIRVGDHMLHYKLTDYTVNSIVFQTFHMYNYEISTLTYYYLTDSIVFEQRTIGTAESHYVRLR